MTTERKAAVAGMFYPGDEQGLLDWIRSESRPITGTRQSVKGIVLPHAGYIYSGACALRTLERIEIPRRVVVVGLNHRYHHERLVIDGHDSWATPLGPVAVDDAWRKRLLTDAAIFVCDKQLGSQEHSLEIMLPLLRHFRADVAIVPIIVGCGLVDLLRAAAIRLAGLIRQEPETLLLASTDMSHFISADEAARIDKLAIDRICALDADGLIETVGREQISMCGVFSTALVIETVRQLGGSHGQVVCYTNSGAASGDTSSVVAYLSAILN